MDCVLGIYSNQATDPGPWTDGALFVRNLARYFHITAIKITALLALLEH